MNSTDNKYLSLVYKYPPIQNAYAVPGEVVLLSLQDAPPEYVEKVILLMEEFTTFFDREAEVVDSSAKARIAIIHARSWREAYECVVTDEDVLADHPKIGAYGNDSDFPDTLLEDSDTLVEFYDGMATVIPIMQAALDMKKALSE